MATQYKPGDIVPKTGKVKCTQYPGTQKDVKAGDKFPPCDNWGQHHPKGLHLGVRELTGPAPVR
jgi:hypothetical protein